MTVRFLQLYPELMNRSGDHGNVMALASRLREAGARVEIDQASFGEEMDFSAYDLIYAGDAPLTGLCLAIRDLAPRGQALKAAADAGRTLLFTGSARALLGRDLRLASGAVLHGAGLLAESHREVSPFTADVLALRPGMSATEYVGSFDRRLEADAASERPLFQVLKGVGDRPNALYEGALKGGIYATYLLGPLLVRNPELMEELAGRLLGGSAPARSFCFDTEAKAAALEAIHRR